jgi:uncharacterized protein YjiS (DUF1127 family)
MFSKTTIALPAAAAFSATGGTMKLRISTSRSDRLSRWSKVTRHIAEWCIRARSRNELMNLSDRTLRDIGVSRYDAEFEASKPFWMA